MNSLALLAHEAHKTPAFNGLYYATVATIIPVLFLALAVQGRLYEDLLTVSGHVFHRSVRATGRMRAVVVNLVWVASVLLAVAILILSVEGEIFAVVSLYYQRPYGAHNYPLYATVLLVVVVAAAPAIAFVRSLALTMRRLVATDEEHQTASPEPATTPSAPAPAEPGETGAG